MTYELFLELVGAGALTWLTARLVEWLERPAAKKERRRT